MKPVSQWGLVVEPDASYRETQAVNSSLLKTLDKESPKHAEKIWSGRSDDDDTKDRKFGRAEHCYILEGREEFERRFLISSGCSAIKKGDGVPCTKNGILFDGQQWFCGIHAPAGAEEPADYINPGEFERIQRVSESIHEHPCVAVLKAKGWSEVSVYWESHGMPCKARLDRYNEELNLIIDLKKMDRKALTVFNCQSEAASYNYFLQAAFYIRAIEAVTGEPPRFMFLFAESHDPFCAIPAQVCHNTTSETLNVADGWVESLLGEWAKHLEKNKFPGPWDNPFAAKLHAPDWYIKRKAPEPEAGNDD